MTPVQRFWGLLKPDRREITQLYVYAIFNGLVGLSLPLGIQAIINLIQGGQMSTSWAVLVAFVIAGIAFGGFLQIMQLRITENLQQKVFTRASFGSLTGSRDSNWRPCISTTHRVDEPVLRCHVGAERAQQTVTGFSTASLQRCCSGLSCYRCITLCSSCSASFCCCWCWHSSGSPIAVDDTSLTESNTNTR